MSRQPVVRSNLHLQLNELMSISFSVFIVDLLFPLFNHFTIQGASRDEKKREKWAKCGSIREKENNIQCSNCMRYKNSW